MAAEPIRLSADDEIVTPGPGQGVTDDIRSSEDKDVEDMTHAELDRLAAELAVDLNGATTKQDKIDRLNAAV